MDPIRSPPFKEYGWLRSIRSFQDLSTVTLARLALHVHRRKVAAGTVIFVEGDPGTAGYFVLRGRVRITKITPEGSEQVLHISEPGDMFGSVVLFDEGRYPATAEAIVASELAYLYRSDYQRLAALDPALAAGMARELSSRLRRAHRRLLSFSAHDVEGRLLELLEQLAGVELEPEREDLTPLRIDSPPTHQEMAHFIGCARETVSRTLSRWRRRGWLQNDGRAIVLTDLPALRNSLKID